MSLLPLWGGILFMAFLEYYWKDSILFEMCTLGTSSWVLKVDPLALRWLIYSYILTEWVPWVIAHTLLFFLGWEPIRNRNLNLFLNQRRSVFIFSHTSHWDYI